MTSKTELLPFSIEGVPKALKKKQRWSPWKSVWSEDRQKWDKIPFNAKAPEYGVSTAKPDKWVGFEEALTTYNQHQGKFAGVGYLMTGVHGIVGIDLDGCVKDGKIADWAQTIIVGSGSYWEFSPSGNGIRIFLIGSVARDWTNHERGIECYAGHKPRFLTVTGQMGPSSPPDVMPAPEGFLDALTDEYGNRNPSDTDTSDPLPEILRETDIPALESINLPEKVMKFLAKGECDGDRSALMFSTGIALYNCGLNDQQVFSVLANNNFVFDIALEKRRQNSDKAYEYLWKEHCIKAKPKSNYMSVDDFEILPGVPSSDAAFDYDLSQLNYIEYGIDGFTAQGITLIVGATGVGKSTSIVPLAACVAHLCRSDIKPELRRHVVYVTEDKDQVERILFGIRKHQSDCEPEEFRKWFHIVPAVRRNPAQLAESICKWRKEYSYAACEDLNHYEVEPLIVFDTSNATLDLDNENDNSEVGKAISAIKQNLGRGSLWLIAHVSKVNTKEEAKNLSARGAGAFEGDVNSVAYLVKDDDFPDKRFVVLGKRRFEPEFMEIEFESKSGHEIVSTPWGTYQQIWYRYGVPKKLSASQTLSAQKEAKRDEALDGKRNLIIEFLRTKEMESNGKFAGLSENSIVNGVTGKESDIKSAIATLVESGKILVERIGDHKTAPRLHRINPEMVSEDEF